MKGGHLARAHTFPSPGRWRGSESLVFSLRKSGRDGGEVGGATRDVSMCLDRREQSKSVGFPNGMNEVWIRVVEFQNVQKNNAKHFAGGSICKLGSVFVVSRMDETVKPRNTRINHQPNGAIFCPFTE